VGAGAGGEYRDCASGFARLGPWPDSLDSHVDRLRRVALGATVRKLVLRDSAALAGADSWSRSLVDGWSISLAGANSLAVSCAGKGDWWCSLMAPPEEPP